MSRTEQRRFNRLETRLPARVHAPGVALEGEVRDYCQAGLLFVPGEAVDRVAAADLPGGTPVEVELEGGPTLPATVARADGAGLGLQVSSLPPEAVALLRAAAVEPAPVPEVVEEPSRSLSTSERQAMQRACQRELAASLNEALRSFFASLPASLEVAVSALEGLTQRHRFNGAAHRVVSDRAGIAARLDTALRDTMRDPTKGRRDVPFDDAPPELSLVDDDQFEEWLCLSSLVNRIESDESLVLAELRRRYSALRGLPLDRGNDPFGPEAILRAFQLALAPLSLPTQVATVVYETFGVALQERSPGLYAALNDILAPLETPAAERRAARKATRARAAEIAAAADRAAAARAAAAAQGDPSDPQTRPLSYPPAPPVPAADGPAGIGAPWTAFGAGSPAGPTPGPVDPAPGAPRLFVPHGAIAVPFAPAAAPFAGGPADAVAAARLTTSLLALVGRLRDGAAPAGGDQADAPVAPGRQLSDPAALPGLLEALLAAAAPVGGAAPLGDGGGPGLSERLTPAIGALPLAPAQRRTVESATGLLGRALSEPDAEGAIRKLLRRLEAPMLRLALSDPIFLDSSQHPGRRLVDMIEQCAIATDDRGRFEDPKLERLLNRVVDRVAAELDGDPTVLERNARLIERLLVPLREARRRRVERLQQAFEARESVRTARWRAEHALAERLGRRSVPASVHALLDAGWLQHMILAEIRGGGRAEAAAPSIETIERLVGALSGADAEAIAAARRAVRTEIEPVMCTIGIEADRTEACLRALEEALDAAERGELPPADTPLVDPEADAPTDAQLAFARRLRIGDWWHVDEDGGPRAMQLVWISTPPRTCGFASRAANHRHELALDAFAGRVDAGRMRPCTDRDSPLLERSELALLDDGWRALRERTQRDPVTGLPNRRGFLRLVADSATDGAARWIGLLHFDTLGMVGTRCGVDAAESLLRALAARTAETLGPQALLGRYGDDTFTLAVPAPDQDDGEALLGAIVEALRDHPFEHGTERYRVGVNVGLARWQPDPAGPDEAVGRAESACTVARERGRNRGQVWDRGGHELRSHESLADWAGQLDRMLEGDGLYLRCQRVEPIAGDPTVPPYYEVLLGIDTANGSVDPSQLVTAIERLDRQHELDLWVMRRTFDWIDAHPDAFEAIGGLAINVSPRSLDDRTMLTMLDERLDRLGERARRVIFELTETSAIQCYGAAQDFIRRVRHHGCKVSLDDFGSGWASYAHLKNLRTDVLKIDGSFVRDIATNPGDFAMVRSMHEVARSLGMRTVAEHVESEEVLEMLRELGIDYAQGWAIHAACRLDAIALGPQEPALAAEPN